MLWCVHRLGYVCRFVKIEESLGVVVVLLLLATESIAGDVAGNAGCCW